LGNLGILGLGTLLIGELPIHKKQAASMITTAVVTVIAAGMILGVGFANLAPRISADLSALGQNFQHVMLFAAGVALTAAALVIDQAMIGLLRGDVQFVRNFFFALVKLLALLAAGLWFARQQGLDIYATWAVGNLVSLGLLVGWALVKGGPVKNFKPQWGWLRHISKSALAHHALNIALQAPALILPLVVTIQLSVEKNAYFYTAWMIAGFVFVGPIALTTVLYAVGSADPSALGQKVRTTLKFSFGYGIAAVFFLYLAGFQILQLFGTAYAQEAAQSLRILVIAVFPLAIRIHFVAIYRVYQRMARAALWIAVCGIFEIVIAFFGAAYGGLPGLCAGWVLAVSIEALFFLPTVYRTAKTITVPEWQSGSEKNAPLAN
ncbi:MAG: hypothetical protein ACK2UW_16950, partial [Anaerolineales bacterium]